MEMDNLFEEMAKGALEEAGLTEEEAYMAIDDYKIMEREEVKLPNPLAIHITRGVKAECDKNERFAAKLYSSVREAYKKEPDVCTDGGNDKSFFSFDLEGKKLWAVANEVGGLTVMFPSEY